MINSSKKDLFLSILEKPVVIDIITKKMRPNDINLKVNTSQAMVLTLGACRFQASYILLV